VIAQKKDLRPFFRFESEYMNNLLKGGLLFGQWRHQLLNFGKKTLFDTILPNRS
jgi:hypothetical protein